MTNIAGAVQDDQCIEEPVLWNASQLVGHNLKRARHKAGMTQQQAADAMSRYTEKPWTQAIFATAESSIAGTRIRQFSASELLAFCFVFDVPIGWFFTPPAKREAAALAMPQHRDGIGWPWVSGRTTPTEANVSSYLEHQGDLANPDESMKQRPFHGTWSRILRIAVDAGDDELQVAFLIGRLRRALLGDFPEYRKGFQSSANWFDDVGGMTSRVAGAFAVIARGHA
jgi:transcriptional regulator with XRE-family HTH domain